MLLARQRVPDLHAGSTTHGGMSTNGSRRSPGPRRGFVASRGARPLRCSSGTRRTRRSQFPFRQRRKPRRFETGWWREGIGVMTWASASASVIARRIALAVVVLVLCVGATACGGDDDTDATTTTEETTTDETTTTTTPLRLKRPRVARSSSPTAAPVTPSRTPGPAGRWDRASTASASTSPPSKRRCETAAAGCPPSRVSSPTKRSRPCRPTSPSRPNRRSRGSFPHPSADQAGS